MWYVVGGDGPQSYSQNSNFQKVLADAAKGKMIEDIINKLGLKNHPNLQSSSLNPFRIADFGCSVGPNTFFAVENIIEDVNLKYYNDKISDDNLEFQVFFNDVTGNYFNTLFKSIPSSSSPTKYFAAGVPGSFYRRLFPCSSLQIAHSCHALHWLSKVPEEVVDRNSAAWNKNSIYCPGLDAEVVKAYSAQFKKDLDAFLSARAEEIVEGGLLIILMAGLPDGVLFSQTGAGSLYSLLGSCLVDLAKQGVISEQKVQSFNLPLHCISARELEETIRSSNGYFSIEEMEILDHSVFQKERPAIKFIVAGIRAVFEGVLKQHLGNDHEEQVDMIFQHFSNKITALFSSLPAGVMTGSAGHQQIDHFILLKRNST